jgi:hypothetical protein
MKYEFHPAALQEYAEAVEFFAQYNQQQNFIDKWLIKINYTNQEKCLD